MKIETLERLKKIADMDDSTVDEQINYILDRYKQLEEEVEANYLLSK